MFLIYLQRIIVVVLGGAYTTVSLAWDWHPTGSEQEDTYKTQPIPDWYHNLSTRSIVRVGYDYWGISTRLNESSGQLFLDELAITNLNLPNSRDTTNPYLPDNEFRELAPWAKVLFDLSWGRSGGANLRARYDQDFGIKLDNMSVSLNITERIGFNIGIVDYRTTWCDTYEVDSPWIRSVNPLCSSKGYNTAVGGAPGIQLFNYVMLDQSRYHMQMMAGIYSPNAFDYEQEFAANWFNERDEVRFNNKASVSLNLLDIYTGRELRLSFLRTYQGSANDTFVFYQEPTQTVDMYYAAISWPLSDQVSSKLVYNYFDILWDFAYQFSDAQDGYLVNQFFYYHGQVQSLNFEVRYELNAKNQFASSLSWMHTRYSQQRDTYRVDGGLDAKRPFVNNDLYNRYHFYSIGLAWRHNLSRNTALSMQGLYNYASERYVFSSQIDNPGNYAKANGYALGLRLAYQF
jgi:hypothetical protein